MVTVLLPASFYLWQVGRMVIKLAIKRVCDDLTISKIYLLLVRRFSFPYQSTVDFWISLFSFLFLFSSKSVLISYLRKPGKGKDTCTRFLQKALSFYFTDFAEGCTWKKGWGPGTQAGHWVASKTLRSPRKRVSTFTVGSSRGHLNQHWPNLWGLDGIRLDNIWLKTSTSRFTVHSIIS